MDESLGLDSGTVSFSLILTLVLQIIKESPGTKDGMGDFQRYRLVLFARCTVSLAFSDLVCLVTALTPVPYQKVCLESSVLRYIKSLKDT